jgi:enoyl-CoA hydratase/carnithine racemase
VLEQAQALAEQIAENAPLAVRTAKMLFDASADWPVMEAFDRQRPYLRTVRESADATEGARAFVEKRRPAWSGS